ncbi:MAG: D-glycero-beta-D-manno-heptose-7-phosphate kinase [Dehalococcoidia bacterium]|nr:D-glycero-beta-D-manno-heptose-7-phosphate kinase [Dehalococcoidia bacterium]
MREHLKRILARSHGKTVLVLGDLMLDEYIWGKVNRISPEAPIPIVEVQSVSLAPGGACNVAANIAKLGGKVALVGVIGKDDSGERLKDELISRGISTDFLIEDPSRPTTLKTRIIAHSQQMVRTDRESRSPVNDLVAARILSVVSDLLAGVDCIIISDYGKGVVEPTLAERIIALVRTAERPITIDPKGQDYSKYRNATIVTPNKAEAAQAARVDIKDASSLIAAGNALLKQLSCEAVLITRGEEGMSLFEANGRQTHLPTFARQVYDITGAGDTVIGTLSLALTTGATLVECANIANHAAGLVVGKIGTASVTGEELEAELEKDDRVWHQDET